MRSWPLGLILWCKSGKCLSTLSSVAALLRDLCCQSFSWYKSRSIDLSWLRILPCASSLAKFSVVWTEWPFFIESNCLAKLCRHSNMTELSSFKAHYIYWNCKEYMYSLSQIFCGVEAGFCSMCWSCASCLFQKDHGSSHNGYPSSFLAQDINFKMDQSPQYRTNIWCLPNSCVIQ